MFIQASDIIGISVLLAVSLGGLSAWAVHLSRGSYARLSEFGALATLGLLLAAGIGLEATGAQNFDWAPLRTADLSFGFWLTRLSVLMAILAAFLTWIVLRFARPYLQADASEKSFHILTHITMSSVLCLILSNHMGLMIPAWFAISFGLHGLLVLKSSRQAARDNAKLKFLVARLGDIALLFAAALIWNSSGSLHLPTILAPDNLERLSSGVGLLLVFAAMSRSAQVPFHAWLPESIDTPTPVSALMHAGIVNAGAYLVLRLWPMVSSESSSLLGLGFSGLLSLTLAGTTMLATSDRKRQLAYSTSAQMGFMFLQLGLGLPEVALTHMIAHAVYKAHAFLGSGTLPSRVGRPGDWNWGGTAWTLGAVGLTILPFLLRESLGWTAREAGLVALGVLLTLNAYLCLAPLAVRTFDKIIAALLPLTIAPLLWLTQSLGGFVLNSEAMVNPTASPDTLLFVTTAVFIGLFLLQRTLGQWPRSWSRWFWTQAQQGFYMTALGKTLIRKFSHV